LRTQGGVNPTQNKNSAGRTFERSEVQGKKKYWGRRTKLFEQKKIGRLFVSKDNKKMEGWGTGPV